MQIQQQYNLNAVQCKYSANTMQIYIANTMQQYSANTGWGPAC